MYELGYAMMYERELSGCRCVVGGESFNVRMEWAQEFSQWSISIFLYSNEKMLSQKKNFNSV